MVTGTAACVKYSQFIIFLFTNSFKRFYVPIKKTEWDILRSQIVISKYNQGGRRYVPYVFTEQGIDQDAHKQIVELRNLLLLYMEKNDRRVNEIIMVLNSLLTQSVQQVKTKRIGFSATDDKLGNYK